jgi:hypothetical protein
MIRITALWLKHILLFAAMIASFPLLLGFLIAVSLPDTNLIGRLIVATLPALITLIAVLLLSFRDLRKKQKEYSGIRGRLLEQTDTNKEDYLASFPEWTSPSDQEFLLEIRQYIAEFFNVPANKIEKDMSFSSGLKIQQLLVPLILSIFQRAYQARNIHPKSMSIKLNEVTTISQVGEQIKASLLDIKPK